MSGRVKVGQPVPLEALTPEIREGHVVCLVACQCYQKNKDPHFALQALDTVGRFINPRSNVSGTYEPCVGKLLNLDCSL